MLIRDILRKQPFLSTVVAVAVFFLLIMVVRNVPSRLADGDRGRVAIRILDEVRRPFLEVHKTASTLLNEGYNDGVRARLEREVKRGRRLVAEFQGVAGYNPRLLQRVKILASAYEVWLENVHALFAMAQENSPGNIYKMFDANMKTNVVFSRIMDLLGDAEGPIHEDIEDGQQAVTELIGLGGTLLVIVLGAAFLLLAAKHTQAKEELSEQTIRLQTTLDNMTGGIFMFDEDLRIQATSPNFSEMYELPVEMVAVGAPAEDIIKYRAERGDFGPGDPGDLTEGWLKRYRNRETIAVEDKVKSGRLMELFLSPLLDGGVIGVFKDITEQKQTEKALHIALVEAKQANQAKSEFLATMSHEFRTPLNAILGFSDILSHQYFGPPGEGKYREYAEDIYASGEHLLELINDLLDISAIEAGKHSLVKEKLSIDQIVRECVKIISEKTRSKGIELVIKVLKNLPPLYADKRAVKQILLNLLSNAVKFTVENGKITVSVKASKRNTTLKITDTGRGIPAKKLPELTNPFIRGEQDPDKVVEGWGLGLSITKSLIDLHDGKLDIKSKVGKGTTVTVTLPNGVS